MYLCHCFALSADDYTDAIEDLALRIITAPSMESAIVLVFHETHKPEDGIGRPRCASCVNYIYSIISDLGLRTDKLTRDQLDKAWLHCRVCENPECHPELGISLHH